MVNINIIGRVLGLDRLHCIFDFTGDPRQDLEYERQYQPQSYIVPEVIKSFIIYFHKVITEQNLYEIQNSYENGYVLFLDIYTVTC